MRKYLNLGHNSSVLGYEYNDDSITVYFANGCYTYSYATAGAENVETMKKIADRGFGLCSFIQRHVRNKFVK